MEKGKDKQLDDLFRKKLETAFAPIPYEPADWDALEQMLDKGKKRKGIIYLLPIVIGIAAIMLLFFGLWFAKRAANHSKEPQLVKNNPAINKTKEDQQKPAPAFAWLHSIAKNDLTKIGKHMSGSKSYMKEIPMVGTKYSLQNKHEISDIKSNVLAKNGADDTSVKTDSATQNGNNTQAIASSAIAENTGVKNDKSTGPASDSTDHIKGLSQKDMIANNKVSIKKQSSFRPQFSLNVIGARDINGVGSFQQSMTGSKAGVLFTVGLGRKFTITAGTLYSSTPYTSGFANYHFPYPVSNAPETVSANCKMLDIPLNVGYQVYHKQRNKIILGAGLSSYIMLQQSFTFNYANNSAANSLSYTYPNNEKYLFSMFNLNATYERQVNSKVGVTIQPYLKLPLTNVGYSQVKLQTTGVALGLSWNLNAQKK